MVIIQVPGLGHLVLGHFPVPYQLCQSPFKHRIQHLVFPGVIGK